MNKRHVLKNAFAFILIASLVACKTKHAENNPFEGNWICMNYIDSLKVHKTPAKVKDVNPEELVFRKTADSMLYIKAGTEQTILPIKKADEEKLHIEKFNDDEYTDFILSGNKEVVTYENKKQNRKFIFKKSNVYYIRNDSATGWNQSMKQFLNYLLLTGKYTQLDKDNQVTSTDVVFTVDGDIAGMNNYNIYEICTGGNCAKAAEEDIIYLYDRRSSGYKDLYIWQFSRDTLQIFSSVKVSPQNEKTMLVKGEKFFSLLKVN